MRWKVVAFAALVCSVGTAAGRAVQPPSAQDVVAKAIRAAGGKEWLSRHQASTWTETGTYYGMGDGVPYIGKYSVQWPDKFRMEIEGVFTIVLNGTHGWIKQNDAVQEMTAEQLAEQREAHYAGWVSTLLPLDDPAFKVTTLPESESDGHAVLGIQVAREGHRNVKLYFDKETGLLAKTEYRVKAEDLGGREVTNVTRYSGYVEVDGAKIPMKTSIQRDGQKFVEAENSDVKPAGKLPASLFEKPE